MNMLLLQRLRDAGGQGADLSPGDPLCAEAADKIEALLATLHDMQGIIRFYHGHGCNCDHCAEPVKLLVCKVFAPHFHGCPWCRCCGQHRAAHPRT